MKTKVYFFRLTVGLTALFLGLGIYFVWQKISAQTVSAIPALVKPVAASSPIFVPLPPLEKTNLVNEEAKTEEETESEFYPDGNYYTSEELPKSFRNIESLSIEANDWSNYGESENYDPKPMLAKGFLQGDTEYKFVKISINNRLISFETEKKNGISYTFVGEFPKESADGASGDLKGVLKKFKDGKQIAKSKVEFYVSGC